ncbi:hypothetical protein P3T35_000408 [Kitasatospora sp. GP30]|uniref:excisionase n=1 Tax=Kitasatospora sp. GP30 TaxID=3035084 RepID=UPI000C711219|nr:excisionase [Kitasatospora sp. GP30]MDH6138431.1 hypothetical protein [Kitasatospora sp. GP30]
MKRSVSTVRRPWWSVEDAASYLGITAAELRDLGTAGIGPKYIEDEVRRYRPADVRLWATTGLTRDSRGWNGEAR